MFEQLWVVVKLVLALVGKGLVTFCNIMNIPEPMNYLAYENINSKLYIAYCEVARESMLKTADEIRQQTHGCSNHSNLEMEAECLKKTL